MKRHQRYFIQVVFWLLCVQPIFGQKYFSRTVYIDFLSSAPLEDIKAKTNEASGIFDEEEGAFAFKVLMNTFRFPKAAMQQHFNQNYIESYKFPETTFKGKIVGFDKKEFELSNSDEKKKVKVKGKIYLHGVEKDITAEGTISYKDNKYQILSKFQINVLDFKIKIPNHLVNNISEKVEITVKASLSSF